MSEYEYRPEDFMVDYRDPQQIPGPSKPREGDSVGRRVGLHTLDGEPIFFEVVQEQLEPGDVFSLVGHRQTVPTVDPTAGMALFEPRHVWEFGAKP